MPVYTPINLGDIIQQAGAIQGQQQRSKLTALQIQQGQQDVTDQQGIRATLDANRGEPLGTLVAKLAPYGSAGLKVASEYGSVVNQDREQQLALQQQLLRRQWAGADAVITSKSPKQFTQDAFPDVVQHYESVHGPGSWATLTDQQVVDQASLLKAQAYAALGQGPASPDEQLKSDTALRTNQGTITGAAERTSAEIAGRAAQEAANRQKDRDIASQRLTADKIPSGYEVDPSPLASPPSATNAAAPPANMPSPAQVAPSGQRSGVPPRTAVQPTSLAAAAAAALGSGSSGPAPIGPGPAGPPSGPAPLTLRPIAGGPHDPNAVAAGMDSRSNVMFNRVASSANEAVQSIKNIVELPVTTSSGWFGGASPGTSLLGSAKGVLAQKITGQDAQDFKTMIAGLSRNLGAIETQGLAVPGSMTHSLDGLSINEGDTNLTKLRKVAEMRQIVEKGLEPQLSNPRLPPQQRELVTNIIGQVQDAVPFTHHDITMLQQSKNPTATIMDFAKQSGLPTKAPSAASGWKVEAVQ